MPADFAPPPGETLRRPRDKRFYRTAIVPAAGNSRPRREDGGGGMKRRCETVDTTGMFGSALPFNNVKPRPVMSSTERSRLFRERHPGYDARRKRTQRDQLKRWAEARQREAQAAFAAELAIAQAEAESGLQTTDVQRAVSAPPESIAPTGC